MTFVDYYCDMWILFMMKLTKVNVSYDSVRMMCHKLVDEMTLYWIPDVILCIDRGGIVPSKYIRSEIATKHDLQIPIQHIRMWQYDESGGKLDGQEPINMNQLHKASLYVKNKCKQSILIVDDILDTGATVHRLLQHVENNMMTNELDIRVATVWRRTVQKYKFTNKIYWAETVKPGLWLIPEWELRRK